MQPPDNICEIYETTQISRLKHMLTRVFIFRNKGIFPCQCHMCFLCPDVTFMFFQLSISNPQFIDSLWSNCAALTTLSPPSPLALREPGRSSPPALPWQPRSEGLRRQCWTCLCIVQNFPQQLIVPTQQFNIWLCPILDAHGRNSEVKVDGRVRGSSRHKYHCGISEFTNKSQHD